MHYNRIVASIGLGGIDPAIAPRLPHPRFADPRIREQHSRTAKEENTMECYNCGQPVPDGSERCPTCGQRFAVEKKPPKKGLLARLGCGGSVLALLVLVITAAAGSELYVSTFIER